MTSSVALDTSVAIPLLVQTHRAHASVVAWWQGRTVALSGHALAETYSVLTRLPGDARLMPRDAARLMQHRLAAPLLIGADVTGRLPQILSDADIAGGAVYDALVALAAKQAQWPLATRDARAKITYEAIGVDVLIVT